MGVRCVEGGVSRCVSLQVTVPNGRLLRVDQPGINPLRKSGQPADKRIIQAPDPRFRLQAS